MFKVQISGRLDGKPRLKRVANRDVCNFTIILMSDVLFGVKKHQDFFMKLMKKKIYLLKAVV